MTEVMKDQPESAVDPQEAKEIAPVLTPVKGTKVAAKSPQELTPEEQMALYEEDLKESDWGHQPC